MAASIPKSFFFSHSSAFCVSCWTKWIVIAVCILQWCMMVMWGTVSQENLMFWPKRTSVEIMMDEAEHILCLLVKHARMVVSFQQETNPTNQTYLPWTYCFLFPVTVTLFQTCFMTCLKAMLEAGTVAKSKWGSSPNLLVCLVHFT